MQKKEYDSIERLLKYTLQLPDKMYERFTGLISLMDIDKKDMFVRPGMVCDRFGFVVSGVLRSYLEIDAEEYIKDFYLPGSIVVSYGSFLNGEPCTGYIQALEKTRLATLSRHDLDMLLRESALWYKLKNHISEQLLVRKCNRETSFLTQDAYKRYLLLLKTYPGIEQYVSQRHIAAYLGIRPESLSRIKNLNIGQ